MIRTKADLRHFIAADMAANGIDKRTRKGWIDYHFNPRIRLILHLRRLEYFSNSGG